MEMQQCQSQLRKSCPKVRIYYVHKPFEKLDTLFDTQFEIEWNMLINLAEKSRVSGSKNSVLNCALRWLQNLKERKNSGLLDTRGDISHLVYILQ